MTKDTAWILAPSDLGSATLGRWMAAIEVADRAGWPMVLLAAAEIDDPLDGLALAAHCASRTRQIGLCATIDPDTVEPFTLARGIATLDHLSGGRAAWRLADSRDPERTRELVRVVGQLLLSWGEAALIGDHANGMLSDPLQVSAIDHSGVAFTVRGPLNIPRPPQGVPPRLALPDDRDGDGADLLLRDADLLRCTILEAEALPSPPPRSGETLATRLGLAA